MLGRVSPSSPFLITGCQRSGTTLLGMVLEAHPEIEIIEENNTRFHSHGKITRELDLPAVATHAPRRPALMTGYKCPRDSHRIREIAAHDGFLVVWVVRQAKQVVSSMLTLRTGRTTWAETYAPREIRKHIESTRSPAVEALFEEATAIRDDDDRWTAFATVCWVAKREQQRGAQRLLDDRMILLDYDDLVKDTLGSVRRVLEFLGRPWSDRVLDHPATIPPAIRPGGGDPQRAVDEHSRSKWTHRLSPHAQDVIDHFLVQSDGGSAGHAAQDRLQRRATSEA